MIVCTAHILSTYTAEMKSRAAWRLVVASFVVLNMYQRDGTGQGHAVTLCTRTFFGAKLKLLFVLGNSQLVLLAAHVVDRQAEFFFVTTQSEKSHFC